MKKLAFYVLGLFCATIAPKASADLPNIVIILADDMGYGDVQTLNPMSRIPTPHLDSLAADGMTFLDAHSPSAVCTPTRYALLTGRYCWRTHLKSGVLNGYSKPLIQEGRPTFATLAKSKGYHTGIVGKWHLGLGWVHKPEGSEIDFTKRLTATPNDNGFDFSYIIPASLDFPPYVYIENRNVNEAPIVNQPRQPFPEFLRQGPRGGDLVMEECLDHLTEQATKYVVERSKADSPFLLYFPLTAPHKPVLPHPRFRGESDLGPYGDFIVQVDATVGRVLKAIDEAGVRENTIVIYTSDNGSFMYRRDGEDHVTNHKLQQYDPKNHKANYVFRGTKADIWEAGHRVPFFVRWPNEIQKNTKNSQTICSVDVIATIAEITGEGKPQSAIDSFSLLSSFKGDKNVKPRPPVIHHSGAGMIAIRDGDWKLVLGNGSGGRESPRGKSFQRPYALFNLKQDIGETTDRISGEEQIARRLEQEFLRIRGD